MSNFSAEFATLSSWKLELTSFFDKIRKNYIIQQAFFISSPSKIDRAYQSTMSSIRPSVCPPPLFRKRIKWNQVCLKARLVHMVQVFLNGPRILKWSKTFYRVNLLQMHSSFLKRFLFFNSFFKSAQMEFKTF